MNLVRSVVYVWVVVNESTWMGADRVGRLRLLEQMYENTIVCSVMLVFGCRR